MISPQSGPVGLTEPRIKESGCVHPARRCLTAHPRQEGRNTRPQAPALRVLIHPHRTCKLLAHLSSQEVGALCASTSTPALGQANGKVALSGGAELGQPRESGVCVLPGKRKKQREREGQMRCLCGASDLTPGTVNPVNATAYPVPCTLPDLKRKAYVSNSFLGVKTKSPQSRNL